MAPKKAYSELAQTIGDTPPKEFNDLTADELATLNRLLSESIDLHEASISEAEEKAVHMAPRPLRGTIRKMLGA